MLGVNHSAQLARFGSFHRTAGLDSMLSGAPVGLSPTRPTSDFAPFLFAQHGASSGRGNEITSVRRARLQLAVRDMQDEQTLTCEQRLP
eukprot:2762295-Amphidinium_carterae.2